MPLQNRSDPSGRLHAVAARGLLTGNRGTIHDPATRALTGRRWTTKAWIACALEWKDRRREVMGRNTASGNAGWTELFFLDEVTALAAGHRPCFFCRRPAAAAFLACWRSAAGDEAAPLKLLDERLHAERFVATRRLRPLAPGELEELPDGAVVAAGGAFFAMREGALLPWTFEGYGPPTGLRDVDAHRGDLGLVTPAAVLAALAAGYRPAWHPSAIGSG